MSQRSYSFSPPNRKRKPSFERSRSVPPRSLPWLNNFNSTSSPGRYSPSSKSSSSSSTSSSFSPDRYRPRRVGSGSYRRRRGGGGGGGGSFNDDPAYDSPRLLSCFPRDSSSISPEHWSSFYKRNQTKRRRRQRQELQQQRQQQLQLEQQKRERQQQQKYHYQNNNASYLNHSTRSDDASASSESGNMLVKFASRLFLDCSRGYPRNGSNSSNTQFDYDDDDDDEVSWTGPEGPARRNCLQHTTGMDFQPDSILYNASWQFWKDAASEHDYNLTE